MLSYFGADQSQVQRYIAGDDLRESRLGLMFNAFFKIPMQFGILLLGVMLFVFYQFHPAPIFFNHSAWRQVPKQSTVPVLFYDLVKEVSIASAESSYQHIHSEISVATSRWLEAKKTGTTEEQQRAEEAMNDKYDTSLDYLSAAKWGMKETNPSINTDDSDYVFIDFILDNLPHGLIGLLVAAFFAAALSSKAAELNALASTSVIDFYRAVIRPNASDRHYVLASKGFTIFWGLVAMGFALFADMSENLIQAANIVGSLFYGVILAAISHRVFLQVYSRDPGVHCGADR